MRRFWCWVLGGLLAVPAAATWSIVAADVETQEVVYGSATCVTGFDLVALAAVIAVGKGSGAAQALVDNSGERRQIIFNGLQNGLTAQEIVGQLVLLPGTNNHQHGVAEAVRGTSQDHTGASNLAHASGVSGADGTTVYSIQGNILTGQPVIDMAEAAFVSTAGQLPERLMAAMEAARTMGGDGRCSCSPGDPTGCGSPPPRFEKSAHIGGMVAARYGDADGSCTAGGCATGDYFMFLNVAFQGSADPDPVLQLQDLLDAFRADLVGRPDAVASAIAFSRQTPDEWLLEVELIDWQGTPLGRGVPSFTVVHAAGSAEVTTIGPVVDLGDGRYRVTLTETGAPGIDVFDVTADDGIRPVVLPPRRATLDLSPLFADGFESGDTSAWTTVAG
jgi:hypothetical protein